MSIPNHHVPFGLTWVLLANGDSNPNREIDQLLGYRGTGRGRAGTRPKRKKRRALSPALVRFQQVLEAF
jgi:hypothetical protein